MLHLYTAEKAAPLAEHLAEVLSVTPTDPMIPEWVAVPSEGMQRWLSLELARHLGARDRQSADGVAANITFGFPGTLRQRVCDAGRPDDSPDPWRVERLTWTVLEIAQRRPLATLPRALTDPAPGVSRYGVARRVADLFDRYDLHRPDMVRAWGVGRAVDGHGRELPEQFRWQRDLWTLCRRQVETPSPAERLPGLLERLRRGELTVDLPERLSLFGLTLLPGGPDFLTLCHAVAATRDLHLFLLEPSHVVRQRLAAVAPPSSGVRLRSEDVSGELVQHPLLRSWGRMHRETAVLLADAARTGLAAPLPVQPSAEARPVPPSLLAQLKEDVRHDRRPSGAFIPDRADRSVQLHACYGATRQVEVLRDVLLHLLADPELELCEDEIVVLCPELPTYAPLIGAVLGPSAESAAAFGHGTAALPPALRYRIADLSIGATNPVLEAMTALVALLEGRFDASAVLDFATLGPVRHRHGFSDDDLARCTEWTAATHIRWGLDPRHRLAFGVPPQVETNTWRAGLDQVLAGVAVHGDGLSVAVGNVVPLETEGDDAGLAGRFAAFLDVLDQLQHQTDTDRPVDDWVALFSAAGAALFAVPPDMGWQFDALHRILHRVIEQARRDGDCSPTPLSFADVRRILEYELKSEPGRPNFFRGGITVTSMTPLRGIPFRVVCLLGMDQGALPTGTIDGDDLVSWAPQLGDRDARGDARQALLEAVLAAGERLVITRNGCDVRTNLPIPRPVAVAELADIVAAMVAPTEREACRRHLETDHPRQAFDPRCFEPGLVGDGPFSFDPDAFASAEARLARPRAAAAFLAAPLHRPSPAEITLEDLHRFLKDPVRAFLEMQLGISLPWIDDGLETVVPLSLKGLARTRPGARLLTALLDGRTAAEWATVEARRGTVPPGVLAPGALGEVRGVVEKLDEAARTSGLRIGPRQSVAIDVRLDDGTRLTGAVENRLVPPAGGPCRVQFVRAKPAHKVAAWLDLVALVANDPAGQWRSVSVTRTASGDARAGVIDLAPNGDGDAERRAHARDALDVAVDLYRRGLAEPLPLFPEVSHAVAVGRPARGKWVGHQGSGERDRPANRLVFHGFEFDDLEQLAAQSWDPPGSGRRVQRYARYLWDAIERSVVDLAPAGAPPRRRA